MVSGKNILIVSSKSADFGGVEFHVLDLIRVFSRANNVYVLCPRGSLVPRYEKAGAKVIIKTPSSPYDFSFAIFVKDFCNKNYIHIVHAHELISAQGLFGAFLARVKKRVWHVHTPFLQWKHSSFLKSLIKHPVNWLVNFVVANFFATDVIALTKEIRKERITKELVFYKKVWTIPNAIDVKKFKKQPPLSEISKVYKKYSIPKNKFVIGNLSRTSAEKGQDTLIKAFNNLYKQNDHDYHLLVAGGGVLQKEYKEYCNKNFKDSFTITGRFDEEDKNALYHVMDLFVFPSLAEGFGYVLVEAMASSLNVISSNLPVLKNVGDEGVMYFKAGSVDDLTEKINQFLKMPESIKKENIAENLKKVEDYSLDAFSRNYSAVYEK